MKYFVITLLIFSVTIPAFAQLTQNDLDKIRLIVKDEVEPIKTDVAKIQGKLEGIDKRVTDARNLGYALIALIIAAIGIPAWRNRKDDQELKKQVETLTQDIEALKKQIQSP